MHETTKPTREDRELTARERALLTWFLENGTPEARRHLGELSELRVVSRCPCGCPSINFVEDLAGGMTILSDYVGDSLEENPVGVFVFATNGRLAGLEVWSVDGSEIPDRVPDPAQLRPFSREHAV
jgi:hypothetical protein